MKLQAEERLAPSPQNTSHIDEPSTSFLYDCMGRRKHMRTNLVFKDQDL
jgi:hypothetical protein